VGIATLINTSWLSSPSSKNGTPCQQGSTYRAAPADFLCCDPRWGFLPAPRVVLAILIFSPRRYRFRFEKVGFN
jgi:hypothetical protein